jgi:pimeloyl-ACP methyl ester carboxylesterase
MSHLAKVEVAEREVVIPAGSAEVRGTLGLPPGHVGIVVFAHGSGSSRLSPRNQTVAAALQHAGVGTLLFDLLTEREGLDRVNVFDIELLSERLLLTTSWLADEVNRDGLPIGFFGASTGAAAALCAAATTRHRVAAVVSRGGRPDLAGKYVSRVKAPTLLIVGGNDATVLELNRGAQRRMACVNELAIIPGATHLFEEPGALAQVERLAAGWFDKYLRM